MILGPNVPPFQEFPEFDADWNEDQWARLLAWLIDSGLVTTKEVASLALGALNPVASRHIYCNQEELSKELSTKKDHASGLQMAQLSTGTVQRLPDASRSSSRSHRSYTRYR